MKFRRGGIAERYRSFSVHDVLRRAAGSGKLVWLKNGNYDGEVHFLANKNEVVLSPKIRGYSGTIQIVPLGWTSCHFGGQRPWFICWCGRRAAVLYFGNKYFRCRKCLGLIHASVNESKPDRAYRKMLKIRRRLGCTDNIMEPILFKPKGMHYKTFRRLLDEHAEAEKIHMQPLINGYLRMTRKRASAKWE